MIGKIWPLFNEVGFQENVNLYPDNLDNKKCLL